jgi:MinD superfamily P-loop ATPase
LGIPAGVIVNRDRQVAYQPLEEFCQAIKLPIMMRIPFERSIAEGIARGQTLIEIRPETILLFNQLFDQITLRRTVSAVSK